MGSNDNLISQNNSYSRIVSFLNLVECISIQLILCQCTYLYDAVVVGNITFCTKRLC